MKEERIVAAILAAMCPSNEAEAQEGSRWAKPTRRQTGNISRFALLAALLFANAAHATEVMATCGQSKGYAYFIEGGAVPSGKGGWLEDGASTQTILVKNGEEYDILVVRDNQATVATSQGAKVFALAQTSDEIIILAIYPGLYERFMFRFSPIREVIWGSTRWDSPVNKDSLYRAECSG